MRNANNMKYTTYFASAYGAGNYDSSTYGTGNVTSTGTGAAGSTGSGNVLANTGFDLVLAATLGSVIIFSAIVIRFWKKPGKQQASAE
jgi:hypothetical protein